jgi:predicted ATPase
MDNIKISNFRKIKDTWQLDLAPITFFTGTNNSGKSTIFKSMLLLEDFVKSNNHFQLDFNGVNQRKHKIDSFSNAVNRINFSNSDFDVKLEYINKNHNISLVFQPMDIDDGVISKGKLKLLEISAIESNDKLSIENTASEDYILKLDLDFLSSKTSDKNSNKEEAEQLALIVTNKNLLKLKEIDLQKAKETRQESINTLSSYDLKRSKTEKDTEPFFIRLYKVLKVLNISLDRAIEFLNSRGIEIEARPTTKVDEATYFLLAEEFGAEASKKSLPNGIAEEIVRRKLKLVEKQIIDLNKEISDGKRRVSELNKKQKITKKNKKDRIVLMPEFSLSDFQDDYLTIDSVIRKILPKYLVEEQTKFGKTDESIELQKAYAFGEQIRQLLRFSVDHLSPHRNTQTRLYINNNMSSDINEVIREHANNPISKVSKAGKFLKKWMREFDIGQDFKIKQIEGVATQIEITHDGLKVNLADKGFGAGQVFTILLKIALSIDLIENKLRASQKGLRHNEQVFSFTILIEEPEANLHPALQVKLANLFYETYKEFGLKFIVETHSEYLLRCSQVLVKEFNSKKTIDEVPFMAYYFGKDDMPYSMEYNKDGKFSNEFGPGFFDVNANLAFDVL